MKSATNVFANYPPFMPGGVWMQIHRKGCRPERSRGTCCTLRALTPHQPVGIHTASELFAIGTPLVRSATGTQSLCLMSILMWFWRQPFSDPRWKRKLYCLSPARSLYFHTNWYQLRRNLRRPYSRGKIISS